MCRLNDPYKDEHRCNFIGRLVLFRSDLFVLFGLICPFITRNSDYLLYLIIKEKIWYSQSFQVEGPQNREISRFIGNTIGRFFRELFKAEKQPATAAIMSAIGLRPVGSYRYTLIQCKKCSRLKLAKAPIILRYETIKSCFYAQTM